jgi:hypothetical protein
MAYSTKEKAIKSAASLKIWSLLVNSGQQASTAPESIECWIQLRIPL